MEENSRNKDNEGKNDKGKNGKNNTRGIDDQYNVSKNSFSFTIFKVWMR